MATTAPTIRSGVDYINVQREVKNPDGNVTTTLSIKLPVTDVLAANTKIAALTAASTAADIVKALQNT